MAVVQGVNPDGTLQETNNYYHSTSEAKKTNDSMSKDSFLQLLVAEMQYQDPLEPQSNNEFVAQFAQFSQVEAMQNMQLTYQQNLGSELVGKPVIMKKLDTTGTEGYVTGRVEYVQNKDSKVYLSIDGSLYDINDLDSIMDEEYYEKLESAAAEEKKKE